MTLRIRIFRRSGSRLARFDYRFFCHNGLFLICDSPCGSLSGLPGLIGTDACRDAALSASSGGNAVALTFMPDGSAGAGCAAGLNDDDKANGDECEDGFHNLPFVRRGFFARMFRREEMAMMVKLLIKMVPDGTNPGSPPTSPSRFSERIQPLG